MMRATLPLALVVVLCSSACAADGPPTFFDLAPDTSSMMLLDLGHIEGHGQFRTVDIANLFRSPKQGIFNRWRIDCRGQTMRIVEIMSFSLSTKAISKTVKKAVISTQSSQLSRTISTLACFGRGNLLKERTYYDDMATIVNRYWK